MAVMTKRRPRPATYGNVAYDLDYLGNVAVERTAAERAYEPQPLVRPRERVRTRTRVQVREQQRVSLFAIAGFLAVAVVAVVVLMGYIQLSLLNSQTMQLNQQLDSLQTEEGKLLSQYERTFDLQAIEDELLASGEMVKPKAGQIFYIDLSEPDAAMVHGSQEENPLLELWETVKQAVLNGVEYFR